MPGYEIAIIPVTLFRQNCTILWDRDSKRAIVVDPGGEPGRILETLDRLGLTVEMLLLTHGHLDHAGGAKALKGELDRMSAERGGGPVPLVGPDIRDKFLLESIEEVALGFGITGLRNVLPDRWLTEGETITLGELSFDVLHCPGHTPGHLVFVERAKRFALVGDVLFQNSVGRTDFPYGDHAAVIASVKDKLLPLGDDISFICGHGPGSTFGQERLSNPYLNE